MSRHESQSRDHLTTPAPAGFDERTHSPDGVDLTLIRWMLSLTPEERLAVLQSSVDSLLRLRREEAEG